MSFVGFLVHIRKAFLPFALFIVMATWFYAPALFEGKIQIHGDSIFLGLPLLDCQHKALHGHGALLWTDLMYGGHPLFAEGQGGFANPLNIFVTFFFSPITGHNVFHWLCIIISCTGTFGLCRYLGANRASSTFGAIALGFSTIWLYAQHNLPLSGSLAWCPWTILAMEFWLEDPKLISSIALCLTTSLMILAGYPQVFHGTMIYMIVSLLIIPFDASARNQTKKKIGKLVLWGGASVILCIGITAIQWLPLVELISLSYRQGGVPLVEFPAYVFMRGFLYSFTSPDITTLQSPGAGSLIVCMVASLSLLFKLPHRIKGHLVAGVFMLQLGIGHDSPLFNYLYDDHMIPGMHYFRILMVYLYMVIISISISASFTLDRFACIRSARLGTDSKNKGSHIPWFQKWLVHRKTIAVLVILSGFWGYAIATLHTDEVPMVNYLSVLIALMIMMLLVKRFTQWIPLAFLMILVLECGLLRFNIFHFADRRIISKPEFVDIYDLSDNHLFKTMETTAMTKYVFLNPLADSIETELRKMIASNTAATNMLWDVPSFNGALGLPLHRKRILDERILQEISGKAVSPPGLRLIDILGIRYITTGGIVSSPAFHLFYRDPGLDITIMENHAALPKFQIYTDHRLVNSPEQALSVLENLDKRILVVEKGMKTDIQHDIIGMEHNGLDDFGSIDFKVIRSTPKAYEFQISARKPGWIFIADANYPGWRAFIGDNELPVYSAQVLGKAVRFPKGSNNLKVIFESTSFALGCMISVLFLIGLVALCLIWAYKNIVQKGTNSKSRLGYYEP